VASMIVLSNDRSYLLPGFFHFGNVRGLSSAPRPGLYSTPIK
jgi:hypothetical protein